MEICTEFLVVEYTVASGKEFMLLLGKIRQQTCPVFQTCRGPAEPSTWNRFDWGENFFLSVDLQIITLTREPVLLMLCQA